MQKHQYTKSAIPPVALLEVIPVDLPVEGRQLAGAARVAEHLGLELHVAVQQEVDREVLGGAVLEPHHEANAVQLPELPGPVTEEAEEVGRAVGGIEHAQD